MEDSYFHKLSNILWGAIVTLIVVLAIYVSFGRFMMSNVEQYDVRILQELNARLPFSIEAEKVAGEWHSFSPEVVLSGLKLTIPGSTELPIELAEGRIALDVLQSLWTRNLQISTLRLDALSLQGELSEDGRLIIAGMGGGGGQLGEWLEQFLLNIESVNLSNNELTLSLPDGQFRYLQLDLAMHRDGGTRKLEAKILSQSTGTQISALADGIGSPLNRDDFVGQLYLDIDVSDLSAFQQLVGRPSTVDINGGLDARVWLAWDRGDATFEVELVGEDVNFSAADQSWQLPTDRVSMQASLVERNDHWTLFATDFEFQKGDILLQLPRLQLDTWGDSLRLRAAELPLAQINALLVDLSLTPHAIADVFEVLNAKGRLTSLQLDIADVKLPTDDWQLTANFSEFEVDSWRGAPGITAGKGFVELAPKGGSVILDSQSFAMSFPTVYRQTLFYEDVYGTIYMDWDREDFTLSSGLLTFTGEEGTAHILFGLNIPLVKTRVSLEMDLLVGLENFDPTYRRKYLPYLLSDALLGWLEPSIGEGRIEQGAFLWRGSLRLGTPDLRTIQLFFNVADTQLNYHPDWPPVSGLDGIVLIDDTNVSVWAESASLYNSKIKNLSAEAWLDQGNRMMLAIDGSLEGAAEDGLSVVNNSPLTEIVGSAFRDWKVEGQLQTELQLQMVLSGAPQQPEVSVATNWQGVDLLVEPGNISLSDINGQLFYSSDKGFDSKDLAGKLWGRPVTVQLRQSNSSTVSEAAPGSYDPADSVIEVDFSTHINMADVRRWLDLDMLAFAEGETRADIGIRVAPGNDAVLTLDSELLGVELDLPQPWGKSPLQASSLHLEMPLAGEAPLLALELQSDLRFHLQLSEGKFTGAALGFYQPPGQVESGILRISGHTPLVDADQWQSFIANYIEEDLLATIETGGGMSVQIKNLGADTLALMGQDFSNVVFSLELDSGSLTTSAETDWLAGKLALGTGREKTRLDIQHLDLDKLDQLNFSAMDGGEPLDLPDMKVNLSGLHRGVEELGELEFSLSTEGETLRVENISGIIAGLDIDAEQPAALQWFQGQEKNRTTLQALASVQDLGRTMEQLGYQKVMETGSGQFNVDLEWPGGPHSFSLKDAEGSVTIALEEGHFLSAPSGASGALRVVSILNLADIIGRLSLSQMFESGIPFRTVDGEVFLSDGTIEVANMEIEGSSSGFQFSGVADVESKSLEGNLVVTLPVANNLPWIVALTAGLPVAAGVFVVSKVFQKQMNRFSSGVYQVSGSWDDPKVGFVRIFDDSSAGDKKPGKNADPTRQADPDGFTELQAVADPNTPPVPDPEPERAPDPNNHPDQLPSAESS